MPYEYRLKRRVEFAETDMAGIMHFSNFFRYMEMAEHEFLRSLGLSVHANVEGRIVAWPRIHAECSYEVPARFEDELEIVLSVRQKRTKSITYDFSFLKESEKLLATGAVTAVCASIDPVTGQMSLIPIPEWIRCKIEELGVRS